VVHAAFLDRATAVLPEEPEPVVALGIDETRRGKSRFVANPYTGVFEQIVDRWHTGFVDLAGDDDRDAVAPVLCSRGQPRPGIGRSICARPTGPLCGSIYRARRWWSTTFTSYN
jgi:hypothetical protein